MVVFKLPIVTWLSTGHLALAVAFKFGGSLHRYSSRVVALQVKSYFDLHSVGIKSLQLVESLLPSTVVGWYTLLP